MKKLVEIKNLVKHFPVKKGLFKKTVGLVKAVDDISLDIFEGETLGLVGESGCGKSTLGRVLVRLIDSTSGEIIFNNKNLNSFSNKQLRHQRKFFQIIFQDPNSSLDPRATIGKSIEEALVIHGVKNQIERQNRVRDMLDLVGISPNAYDRFPHEFSGGQRQRIGIARALILKPKLVVCDEPVSALDVSVQAQVLNLLNDLKEELSLTLLFISHNLSVVENVSDRIAIMYLGHIVELLESSKFAANCKHPYSKALLSAIPIPDPNIKKKRIILKGDVPSPINPPSGCVFRTRCPTPTHDCKEGNIDMGLIEVSPGHWVDQCCVNCG
ncbi:MAG: ATP-binding cassette domain-containing protein [Pelagibacteraceae bacterium]|jgi:oligopeptide/dipeptide ABC transporter ATP-binding protein|nr:ATP-binding cassette domain-containing protein [Pelagibacteraceae bacterium]MBT5011456.1 ATP-binding cassette domain-containing protein [Flavobacteriaceae bacterium]MBT3902297.1 ATP-binding cassette domain-containing protein [Pelagibacteraceae bacterium]MBT4645682.1 ATP-binding cassette domain-containing protein [Pelagibacteraceae bacterium]MBT5213365.1 ATP-binding cassette domain-containing protein [Pelagibacteraceae bacterium]